MDRELSPETKLKAKRRIYLQVGLVALLLLAGLAGFRLVLKPTLKRADIKTAVASLGSIEASLTATGVVVPEKEEVITSPIEAKIERVLHRAGEEVNPDESILQLDKESVLIAYEKLKDEQEMNRNLATKQELTLQKNLNDLQAQYAVKQLRVKSLQSVLEDEKYLLQIGGGTQENVRQAELNLKVAHLELEALQEQIINQKKSTQADLKELGYKMQIQGGALSEAERKIRQADVKATQRGVLTWVNENIGTQIRQGDALARVADLSSFKVQATISDTYAGELRPGGAVVVRVNDTDLRGSISSIRPTVENGLVTFFVTLQEKAHPLLRSNLRVDVFVVTSFVDKVVRVKNGPFYNGTHDQPVFVIKGDKAVRRHVQIGASNFDFVELKNEVEPGEEVIISDMSEYKHMEELTLK